MIWRLVAFPSAYRRAVYFLVQFHNHHYFERFIVMKTTTKLIGILTVFSLLMLVAGNVSAQMNVKIDEYGVGTLNGAPLPFSIAPDPLSGTLNLSTLMYQLPFPVRDGDVFLMEVGPAPQAPSDLVRFENNSAGGVIYFYSDPYDASDIGNPLADNAFGVPPANTAGLPIVFLTEAGVEGSNGVVYTPNPSAIPADPGSFQGALVTYTILSDSVPVPEPTTLALLGMSTLGLLSCAWRKRK
jgi:PEP-CTERM motif